MESFYKDPEKDMKDPDICIACNCDTDGTQYELDTCTSEDDESGTVAGQCECKTNVGGLQCDHCAAGGKLFNMFSLILCFRLLELHHRKS